ncbi:hypothetical protein [Desulforhopalus singaporensis]|uniref:Uncharacterized protein n=1 Tax=Desulforhopalus singaporensis TaxID=91360 RepID=A0A1H0UUW7_9BACT|nr:hypothetical protein [Desulforhopalus singaporensis]SDP69708.1 hypothetical protein SAMN05660330_03718 [Desulforhopalus singaporensis]
MFDALDKVVDRWGEILNGAVFESPSGVSREMRIIVSGLDSKRMPGMNGNDYPFTQFRIVGGDDGSNSSKFSIIIVAGLYVNPDTDGDGDIDTDDAQTASAKTLIQQIVSNIRALGRDGNYSPYSLEGLKWQIGDQEGSHPGPDLYVVAAELLFSQEPIF